MQDTRGDTGNPTYDYWPGTPDWLAPYARTQGDRMATNPQQQILQSPIMQAIAARKAIATAQPPGQAQILQRMLAQARQRSPRSDGGTTPQPPQPYRPGLPQQPVPAAAPVMAAPTANRYPINLAG